MTGLIQIRTFTILLFAVIVKLRVITFFVRDLHIVHVHGLVWRTGLHVERLPQGIGGNAQPEAVFLHDSVRIRTDTTLDQDCVLKATVQVCTACMIMSLLTTCLNFNTPPLAQVAPFRCKIRESNAGSTTGHKTQQARLPADCGLHNSTFPSLVNCILTVPECQSDHHGSSTSTMVLTKCLLSLYHPRASLGS